jgi:hypothetical protein
MRVSVKAAGAAALLAAVGCGNNVVYVPLARFATIPLHGEFGYFDDGSAAPGAQALASVELDRHPDCSALDPDHTARFNGRSIEAASLGGLGPGGGDSGPSCGWPLFTVVESRTDALPAAFSDGDFELEDASHRMRMRVRDWVGPHGPELPEGPVDVTRGQDLTVVWRPASADLSRLTAHVAQANGTPGAALSAVVVPGGLRVGTSGLAVGTHTLGFSGFAQLQVLECTGVPECRAFARPHYLRHTLQVRVLAP